MVALLSACAPRVGQVVGLLREDIHLVPAGSTVPGCPYSLGPHLHLHLHLEKRDGHPRGAANKNRGTVIVPVPQPMVMLYADWMRLIIPGAGNAVWTFVSFPGPTGEPGGQVPGTRRVKDLISDLARDAGIRHIHPHKLRHTFGENAADLDVACDVLQRLLGHRGDEPERVPQPFRRPGRPRRTGRERQDLRTKMTTSAPLPAPAPAAGWEPAWDYLARQGLDRSPLQLRFPLGADWHSLRHCRHTDCERPATSWPWLCHRCASDWQEAGAPDDIDRWSAYAPVPLARRTYAEYRCRVGCDRAAEVHGLCKSCASERRVLRLNVEEYLARGREPRPGFGKCLVRVCPRMAVVRRSRLCLPHQRQWSNAGTPDREAWALTATAVYTSIDVVPLADLAPTVVAQVLRGYEAQLRQGGRINPAQVKSAVRWLCDHTVNDLTAAELPSKGAKTTYLRLWQRTLPLLEADPATEHTRPLVRLHILNPRYKGGSVDLQGVQAPWVTHLAQQYLHHLAAAGASSARLMTVGYASRWFALFLRTLPGEGRRPGDVGRDGMLTYLCWLTRRARDTSDYQLLNEDDPVRQIVAERLLPSRQGARPLLVTPVRHHELVKVLREVLEHGRTWLADNHAADVHLQEMDVPP